MRRRPGLWLTLGALAAGVVLLGAAGCGGGNNSGGAASGNTNVIPPHQKGGQRRRTGAAEQHQHKAERWVMVRLPQQRIAPRVGRFKREAEQRTDEAGASADDRRHQRQPHQAAVSARGARRVADRRLGNRRLRLPGGRIERWPILSVSWGVLGSGRRSSRPKSP